MQPFLASALLHIVSSGNNAATVHFSQCDKRQSSGEYLELLSLGNMRNNRQRWNVLHLSVYFCSYKRYMQAESAEKNVQLVLHSQTNHTEAEADCNDLQNCDE